VAARKICPRCAEKVKSIAKVCRHCGHEFDAYDSAVAEARIAALRGEPQKQCPQCSLSIKVDAIDCPYCAYRFSEDELDATRMQQRRIEFAAGVAALLVIALVAWVALATR
jgi:predicted amidophosphoribosyltransferase